MGRLINAAIVTFVERNGSVKVRSLFLMLATLLVSASFANAQDTPGTTERGRQLFSSACAQCHGLDGQGGEHAPNITTSARVQSLSDTAVQKIISKGIPSAGMPGFDRVFDHAQIDAVLAYLRAFSGSAGRHPSAGDPVRGRTLFFEGGRCSGCHMVSGQGGYLGLDLSGYGRNHDAKTIRERIMFSDWNADLTHGTVIAHTRLGLSLTGVIRNEDNFSLQMQTADGAFHLLEKTTLASIEHPSAFSMHSDGLKTLTRSQLDDLVSFLLIAPSVQPTTGAEQRP